jgi:hypothetical protein
MCLSVFLSATTLNVEALEPDDETNQIASIEVQNQITDYETIRSLLMDFAIEQEYDSDLGMVIGWKELNGEPDGKLRVIFDYVPLDNLELDEEATKKCCEFMEQNNIDSSLVEFIPASKPPLAIEGKINDTETIALLLKSFVYEQQYEGVTVNVVNEEYGKSLISRVEMVFPQKSVGESDYTSDFFAPLNDFMIQNDINVNLVKIMYQCASNETEIPVPEGTLSEPESSTTIPPLTSDEIDNINIAKQKLEDFIEENNIAANVFFDPQEDNKITIICDWTVKDEVIPLLEEFAEKSEINSDILLFAILENSVTEAVTTSAESTNVSTETAVTTDVTESVEQVVTETTVTATVTEVVSDTDLKTGENETEKLPQTGMPFAKTIEGIAVLLTIGGATLIVKSCKEKR